ncbi:MAG: MBL fold metallo-hydrolase [Myxococcota bacterium]
MAEGSQGERRPPESGAGSELPDGPFTEMLGVAQDGGHPQAGCQETCCAAAWADPRLGHRVASMAVVDPISRQRWIIDASPDFPIQLRTLDEAMPVPGSIGLDGVLLTHAHIGHYTGLMHLGREALGATKIPVYAMPKMQRFLRENGPWELLDRLDNIEIMPLSAGKEIQLNERIHVCPIQIPHRSEYTETVGFVVRGPQRSVLYIPDIDKWDRWSTPIEKVIATVDRAYLDGTFFADGEIKERPMAEIPHPFVMESIERFRSLESAEKSKIHFFHLNHTNPLLDPSSSQSAIVREQGMHVARRGDRLVL